jgi:hypothetical protein
MRMMSRDDLRRTSRTILKADYLRLFLSYYSNNFDVNKSVENILHQLSPFAAYTLCILHATSIK